MIVVDASVALKWFFMETDAEVAENLLERHSGQMCMPELFVVEVLNGLVRTANADPERLEAVRQDVADFLTLNRQAIFSVRSAVPHMARATDIALALRHPLKDCVYLALAESLDCRLVTADLRFAAKAREVYPAVTMLGDGIA